MKSLLERLPKAVEFSEIATAAAVGADGVVAFAAPEGHVVGGDRLALHQKALNYQKLHPEVDYVTAVKLVT